MNVPFQRAVTAGLEIRLFQPAEAETVFASVERNRAHLREWLPWVDGTEGAGDVAQFIERVQNQWDAGLGPQCGIWAAGEFAGSIGVHPIDWSNRHCSVGYWLEAGRQGGGIISRCCAALLDYLLLEHGLHRVEIHCGVENHRSAAVPKRLGFTREGVMRQAQWVRDRWLDMEVWGLLQDEWHGSRERHC